MGATLISDVQDQVQKFWAPIVTSDLQERTLLPGLVNKEYEGQIKRGGDTVRVTEILTPSADRRKIGQNSESFRTEKLRKQYVDVKADTVITASFEFEDLVEVQSQIEAKDSKIREALLKALMIDLNALCYEKVAPSSSSPDHVVDGVTDFNAAQLRATRLLASQARWPTEDDWYLLLDPSYQNDLLGATTLTSSDYVGDRPTRNGVMAEKKFNFWIFEDNSDAILDNLSGSSGVDAGLAFHPDFLHLVMGSPEFKISDLHPNKQHGFLISCKIVCGATLGNDGAKKHIRIYNT